MCVWKYTDVLIFSVFTKEPDFSGCETMGWKDQMLGKFSVFSCCILDTGAGRPTGSSRSNSTDWTFILTEALLLPGWEVPELPEFDLFRPVQTHQTAAGVQQGNQGINVSKSPCTALMRTNENALAFECSHVCVPEINSEFFCFSWQKSPTATWTRATQFLCANS